jgi:hypothetical protein
VCFPQGRMGPVRWDRRESHPSRVIGRCGVAVLRTERCVVGTIVTTITTIRPTVVDLPPIPIINQLDAAPTVLFKRRSARLRLAGVAVAAIVATQAKPMRLELRTRMLHPPSQKPLWSAYRTQPVSASY